MFEVQQERVRQMRRMIGLLTLIANWLAAFHGACILASVALIISAYTQLASVTGDICIPSHFVAATVELGQNAGRTFFLGGCISLIAVGLGSKWLRPDAVWQSLLTGGLQSVLIAFVIGQFTFNPKVSGIHTAFARQWFAAESIQDRWNAFRKECP